MFELTQDISTIIIHRGHNVVVYYSYADDRNWIILGKCDESKGLCERKREELDCPVTPELKCKCGLVGVYL